MNTKEHAKEHDRLTELDSDERCAAIAGEIDKIQHAANSGTVDRDAINASLERLAALNQPDRNDKPDNKKPDTASGARHSRA